MADYTVRQGDDFTITDVLRDAANAAVNIAAALIKITIVPLAGGAPLLNAVAAINDQVGDGSDGSKGKVHYSGGGATTATPGKYLLTWLALFGGTVPQAYPNGGYILFEITPDVPVAGATRFAESTELETRLGLTFSAEEHIRANTLLERASGIIQDEYDQTVKLVTDDTLARRGTTDDRILLPQRPVVSVSSVRIDGSAISDWYLNGDEIVRGPGIDVIDVLGFETLGYRGFGYEAQTLTIVYTHGYSAIPEVVKSTVVEMVSRVWINPGSVIQATVAGTETTYAPYSDPPRGLMLTDSERAALRRLFGSRSGSVPLRG